MTSAAVAAEVMPEPGGATVHCVSVKVMVFDHGKPNVLIFAPEP
jgi:hypothetical protein